MSSANIPNNESSRLHDLHQTALLDSPEENEFDEIVNFASVLCNTKISLISLVDSNRQWFKAKVGLSIKETPRDISFCSHAILQDQLFMIRDAMKDSRFADNPLVLKDPSIRFYAGMPLVTSSGSRLGTLCVIDQIPRELTETQKLGLQVLANNVIKIAELRIKNKELYYLTETQKRIISILAHDVRNPLASIKNIIELKKSEVLDADDAADMMDMVSRQLNGTLQMVENVVNWGQLHLQFRDLQLEDFDIHELVGHIFGTETLNALNKGNRLVNKTEKGALIYSDRRALEFILRNLLSNANKFTQNGTIAISMESQGLKSVLHVTDTGVGMPEEQAKELLAHNTFSTTLGTNKEKGSGLGLLLVKEFIERMDGTITVKSALNKGTDFEITI